MKYNFNGKIALVTGAGKGIGRALSKQLSEFGAKTYALSRTKADLLTLESECPAINIIECDLMDYEATQQAVSAIGPIDLLVNNAAIAICQPFLEIDSDVFQKIFRINVEAAIQVSQISIKTMLERHSGGSIVNVSSQASMTGLGNHTVYGASKAALDQVTRNMSFEFGPHKIRVNSINPTVVNTAMAKVGWSDPKKADPMKAQIPLGRFAEVEEVVSVITFLLSDDASMVSGTCVPIDGGALASMGL